MTTAVQLAQSVAPGVSLGFKNRIINGAMTIDQRNAGAAQTITNVAAYTVDRWQAYATGANVTGQRVSGSNGNLYNYQFTGAASNTNITFIQKIESLNSADLAGQTVTLSALLANSSQTTIGWAAYYANSTDNFGSLTAISNGAFTVNSTLTKYNAQISIPAAATTGLYICLFVVNQTSGTWTIGQVQLEKGSTATSFDYRPYGTELALCQRYYYRMNAEAIYRLYGVGCVDATNSAASVYIPLPVTMRAAPTASALNTALQINGAVTAQSPTFQTYTTGFMYVPNTFVGTTGQAFRLLSNNTTTGYIDASAEL